jgi:hypothetical protein
MKALLAIATVVVATATAAPAWGDTFITDTLAPGGGHSSPYDAATPVQQHVQPRFITDTLAPGGGKSSPYSAPVLAVSKSGSFSWADAGIGAGAATGALVALLGATLVIGRQRQRLAV